MNRTEGRPTFSLLGIPVKVEPWFFLIIALLGLSYEEPVFIASWVAIAFVSVLLHEMGHALAFRAFGMQPRVLLHGFGGLTSGEGHLTPWRSIAVSLAGPLAPLLLIGLPAVYAWSQVEPGDAEILLGQVVFINVAWSVLNLVPVLPLDGGNVTASLADLVVPGKGRRVAAVVSLFVLAGLAALSLSVGYVFGLFLAVWFGYMNLQELRADSRHQIAEALIEAQHSLMRGDPVTAERQAREALAIGSGGELGGWGVELIGWARLWQGDPTNPVEATGPSLKAARVYATRPPAEARTTAAWALTNDPNPMARRFLLVLLMRMGEVVAVAAEMVAAGAVERVVEVHEILVRDGRHAEAAQISTLLAAPGSTR